MSNEFNDFITGVGALAEAMRLFRDELLKNGFTRNEAIYLTKAFMHDTFSSNKNKEEY